MSAFINMTVHCTLIKFINICRSQPHTGRTETQRFQSTYSTHKQYFSQGITEDNKKDTHQKAE
jgi:hypothetical protein